MYVGKGEREGDFTIFISIGDLWNSRKTTFGNIQIGLESLVPQTLLSIPLIVIKYLTNILFVVLRM